MRIVSVLAGLVVASAYSDYPVPPHRAGPAWSAVGPDYERTLPVKGRSSRGMYAYYDVPLERCNVWLHEKFDKSELTLRADGLASVSLDTHRETKTPYHIVTLGETRHYDIDGDGLFDIVYDGRPGKKQGYFIMVDGERIEVMGSKSGFGPGQVVKDFGRPPNTYYQHDTATSTWKFLERK
jgi:hypothetical protein